MRDQSPDPSQDRFLESMQQAAAWLERWESGELSDEVLADHVAALVVDRDGARGFFVVAMTSEIPLIDRLPEPLLAALRQAGEPVVDLTVRNLVMSTAMALHHQRQNDGEQQQGSLRVQRRALDLLKHLEPEQVRRRLEPMLAASRLQLHEPSTPDQADTAGLPKAVLADSCMMERWGYDGEQRSAIGAALERVAEPC